MADKGLIERLRAMIREIEERNPEARPEIPAPEKGPLPYRAKALVHPEPASIQVRDNPDYREITAVYKTGSLPWLEPCLPDSLDGFRSLEPCLESLDGWLYLDIETTGLGGAATFAFLVGLGEWTQEGFVVTQFLLTDRAGEEALLQAVRDALDSHRTLVTFNGKTFDVPVINSRFVLSGIRPPAGPHCHLDLLALARNMGKRVQYGHNLKDSVRRFAGVAREGDVAGNLIPALYFIYEREKDASVLDPVLKHNRLDVLDMACLARVLGAVVTAAENRPKDNLALSHAGKMHYRKGNLRLARKCLETASAEGPCEPDKRALLAQVMRRQGDWEGAKKIWEELTGSGLGTAEDYLWLARYHELVMGDLQKSLEIVEQAISRFGSGSPVPEPLQKRKARLLRRISASRKRA